MTSPTAPQPPHKCKEYPPVLSWLDEAEGYDYGITTKRFMQLLRRCMRAMGVPDER